MKKLNYLVQKENAKRVANEFIAEHPHTARENPDVFELANYFYLRGYGEALGDTRDEFQKILAAQPRAEAVHP